MRMLRTLRLDAQDDELFPRAAGNDEAAIPGAFSFTFGSDDLAHLTGKPHRAFASGFLGLTSFGRASLAVISECKPSDYVYALESLTEHLLKVHGAPNVEQARRVAEAELRYAKGLCDQPVNTVLSLARAVTDDGVEEHFMLHDSRALWERDTLIFTPIPDTDEAQ